MTLLLLHHRDAGVMFDDGTFTIKGRRAEAIRFKILCDVIYPGPIENVISKHPAIANASVSVFICSVFL